jgi:hypothetical protein
MFNTFSSFHLAQILLEQARDFEKVHLEKLTGGEIGMQIAYLDFLKDTMPELKRGAKEANNKEVEALYEEALKETNKLELVKHENNEIYKAPVPQRKDLPAIPESEHKVTPLD